MPSDKIIFWCNRATVFSFAGLIFFLPISTALVEVFSTIILNAYFIRHCVLFAQYLKLNKQRLDPRPFIHYGKVFVRTFKPASSHLSWPIGMFILANFLSLIFSQCVELSIKGFIGKLIQGTFLFFSFLECFQTRKQLKAFILVLLASAALVVVNGLYQQFVGYGFIHHHPLDQGRVMSSFNHSNDFGGYLVAVIPIALSLLLFCRRTTPMAGPRVMAPSGCEGFGSWKGRAAVLCLFLASLACLGYTYSRGAWVGFFGALVVFAFYRWKQALVPVVVTVIFLFVFFPRMESIRKVTFVTDDISQQQALEATVEKSAQPLWASPWEKFMYGCKHFGGMGRKNYWKEARTIIQKFPALGIGVNTYSKVAPEYKITWGGYPHNCYLQMAAEIGLVGLAVFLWVIFALLFKAHCIVVRRGKSFCWAVLFGFYCGFLGFLAHSFVDTNFYSVQLGVFLWVMMAVIVVAGRLEEQGTHE